MSSSRQKYARWRKSLAAQDSLAMLHRKQLGLCYHCRQPTSIGQVEIDHLLPLSMEGDPIHPENLVVSCLPCNRKKGRKLMPSSTLSWWLEAREPYLPSTL
jgi:5-methylcytosine-specific restriction endonuclease McrA